jgi:hypothetical protein
MRFPQGVVDLIQGAWRLGTAENRSGVPHVSLLLRDMEISETENARPLRDYERALPE